MAAKEQCTINSFVRVLDTFLCFISGGVDINTHSSTILNTEPLKNCEFKERTYRLTLESHEKDENGDLILSQEPLERDTGLFQVGGKQRIKLSLSYYDSTEDEIPDESIKHLATSDLTFHDTKTLSFLMKTINALLIGTESLDLTDPLHLNSYSPKRVVVNHHFRYIPPSLEEGKHDSPLHKYIMKGASFCDWVTFNVSTASSRDDLFNFVYGGSCKSTSILQYRGPRNYRTVIPDEWLCSDNWISNYDV